MTFRGVTRSSIIYIFGLALFLAALPSAHAGESQHGLATWHEPSGGGCRTASAHRWVSTEMVAAHRTLPLGTRVRVVNLSNGHEAVVRITDRGPYGHGRVIDVSRCAAAQLGLLHSGIARVRVETLPRDGI